MHADSSVLPGLAAMARGWAQRAHVSFSMIDRAALGPTAFTVGRRPEERALLAAAVELRDFVAAQPGGLQVLVDAGMEPPPALGAAVSPGAG